MKKPSMNEDIAKFGVYSVNNRGQLFKCPAVKSTNDYNHFTHEMHHYIKSTKYYKDESWYIQRGIQQRLILMPKQMHIHLENPVYMLSDSDFKNKYHIDRTELLFSKKTSKY